MSENKVGGNKCCLKSTDMKGFSVNLLYGNLHMVFPFFFLHHKKKKFLYLSMSVKVLIYPGYDLTNSS